MPCPSRIKDRIFAPLEARKCHSIADSLESINIIFWFGIIQPALEKKVHCNINSRIYITIKV